jgi:hypothetical protein
VFYKEEYHDLTERMRTLKAELARERKKEMRFKIVESFLAYIFSVVHNENSIQRFPVKRHIVTSRSPS